MPRRHILTERKRSALFDLPTDELSLLRHYTLADDDLQNIQERRRQENRLGFALQLCALRYPGRALTPGEMIPQAVLSFIGAQLGIPHDALTTYAARRQTRQQHMGALRKIYSYKTFTGRGARDLGRQGEIRDRTTEGQHYRIAGLNLLTAIIIYWNTVHLDRAVTGRRKEGLDVPPELLAHISPLGWAHILLTGEYLWPKQKNA